MAMWIKILAGVVLVIVLFIVVVALQPSSFHIARSASIAAPRQVAFEQVNVIRNWEPWNPWLKLDPNVKTTYEGPAEGKGAISRWVGDKNVGEGSMTIIESRPDELVRLRLDFLKPYESTCTAEFAFQPEGDHTMVTWSMDGEKNFVTKMIGLFMGMDKMIGEQFAKGLTDMNATVAAKEKQ
jgi:hypothetical protein